MALSSQTATYFTKQMDGMLKRKIRGVVLFFEERLKASNIYSCIDVDLLNMDGVIFLGIVHLLVHPTIGSDIQVNSMPGCKLPNIFGWQFSIALAVLFEGLTYLALLSMLHCLISKAFPVPDSVRVLASRSPPPLGD